MVLPRLCSLRLCVTRIRFVCPVPTRGRRVGSAACVHQYRRKKKREAVPSLQRRPRRPRLPSRAAPVRLNLHCVCVCALFWLASVYLAPSMHRTRNVSFVLSSLAAARSASVPHVPGPLVADDGHGFINIGPASLRLCRLSLSAAASVLGSSHTAVAPINTAEPAAWRRQALISCLPPSSSFSVHFPFPHLRSYSLTVVGCHAAATAAVCHPYRAISCLPLHAVCLLLYLSPVLPVHPHRRRRAACYATPSHRSVRVPRGGRERSRWRRRRHLFYGSFLRCVPAIYLLSVFSLSYCWFHRFLPVRCDDLRRCLRVP